MAHNAYDAALKVWVGNVPIEAAAEDLDTHFRQLGEPVLCEIVRRGVGVVVYGSAEEADTAASAFNGSEIGGALIQTAPWAAVKGSGKAGGGKAGGGKAGGGGGKGAGYGAGGAPRAPVPSRAGGYGTATAGGHGGHGAPSAVPQPVGFIHGKANGKGAAGAGAGAAGGGVTYSRAAYGGGLGGATMAASGQSRGVAAYGGAVPVFGGAFGGGAAAAGGHHAAQGHGGGRGGGGAHGAHGATSPVACWLINVPGSATLAQQRCGPEGFTVSFQKGQEIFGNAAHLLAEFVGDAEVAVTHDTDWEIIPEIGAATQQAAGEQQCIALATHDGAYGVGMAAGWKGREAAVKVALSLALLQRQPHRLAALQKSYPEFCELARSHGVGGHRGGGGGGGGGKGAARAATSAAKGYGGGGGGGTSGGGGGGGGYATAGGGDVPPFFVLALPEDAASAAGLAPEAPCIMHGSKHHKHFFSNAYGLLGEFLEDPTSEVVLDDDPEGERFPEVYEAWKAVSADEEAPVCAARCEALGVWGLGMAWGKKNRETAARLALAVAIAQANGRLDEMASNPNYPEFGQLAAAAGLVEPPQKKRRQGGW